MQNTMPQELSVELPKISTNAFNNFHYHKKAEMVREVHQLVAVAVKEQGIKPVEKYPVHLLFDFTFKSRPLDIINCSSLCKATEDALIVAGILKDDSPKWVAQHNIASKKTFTGTVCDIAEKEGVAYLTVSIDEQYGRPLQNKK